MQPLFPWIEANAGLASITLSTVAILAAFYLAYVEYRRATRAEDARLREPAQAALYIVDLVLGHLRGALAADEEIPAEAELAQAQLMARRFDPALKQIAATAGPSAELIFALHNIAASFAHVWQIEVPDYDKDKRTFFCRERIHALEVSRRTIEKFAKPSKRSTPRQSISVKSTSIASS